MNALVKPSIQIADKHTVIIEYNSLPVMLTEQLADFYGTESVRIRQNHDRNNERFVEGKHFFKVEGEDLKILKNSLSSLKILSPNTRSIMLWTEKGASRHAKILDTDQAWNIFEQLEDCYFSFKENTQQNAIALPNFSNPAEAARAWAVEYEAKQIAEKERDHAIETKAHISDKKTATAMATASAKSRQAEILKEQLGESKNYASIKAVEIKTGGKYGWHKLKKWCEAKGEKIKDIADPNFGTVKIYPREAWEAVYGIKLNSIFQA